MDSLATSFITKFLLIIILTTHQIIASPSSIPNNSLYERLILKCKVHTLNRCDRHCHVCESDHLNVTSPHTKLVEVTGFSVRNVAFNNNVIRLSINNQVCRFIPSDTDQFFPNLETLRIWSCGLRRLTQVDIRGFDQLRELILPLNEIEMLDSDLFQFNKHITKIDLSRNKLKNVGLALFTPVSKELSHVNFNHNECIDDNLRGPIDAFGEKIRKLCPPTISMLQSDVLFLIEQNERLKLTIEAKDTIMKESCDLSKYEDIGNKFESETSNKNNYQRHRFIEVEVE